MQEWKEQRLKWFVGNFATLVSLLSAMVYLRSALSSEVLLGLGTLLLVLLCIVNVLASRFGRTARRPPGSAKATHPPDAETISPSRSPLPSRFDEELISLREASRKRRDETRYRH